MTAVDAADPTRWSRLFADLGAEYDAVEAAEVDLAVRERARGETARLRLGDRLRPAVGGALVVETLGAGQVRGRLDAVGPDWVLLDDRGDVLVPLRSVLAVNGLGASAAVPGSEGQVEMRLDLRHALRELARRRVAVAVALVDGKVLHGTFDRVGEDFVELAEHPPGEPRRANAVRGVRTLPFSAVATVRST